MVLINKGEFLALCYHDIFEYPLLKKELGKWEVGNVDVSREVGSGKFWTVQVTGEYYHLPGREQVVLKRIHRASVSEEKLKKAGHAAQLIGRIPTVQFVGITGSLSMNNSQTGSDIDLFIITKRNTLWTTRLIALLLTKLLSVPTRRAHKTFSDNSLCLNLWLNENHLMIPEDKRNIYTAHEVLQILPLVNKNKTFEKFLAKNIWARDFWPRGKSGFTIYDLGIKKRNNLTLSLIRLFEPIAYRFQLWHMRSRLTRERIEPGRAFFHPIDWGEFVMREFIERANKKEYMATVNSQKKIFANLQH